MPPPAHTSRPIKRALDEIEAADAELGGHLRASIRTGYSCTWSPSSVAVRSEAGRHPDD